MKNPINKKLSYILPAVLLLLAACTKNDSNISPVVTQNYNASISAATKNSDYVAVDVDNDKVPDFKISTSNSSLDGFLSFETRKDAYITPMQDSTLVALTNSYSNSGWYRVYVFYSLSMYYTYTKGFGAGAVIGAAIPDHATALKNNTIATAFGPGGKQTACMANAMSPDPANPKYTEYNEVEGDFYNTTQYIGFSMLKADGRHYGWIKIAVSDSNVNVKVISSGYGSIAGQAITAN